MYVSKIGNRSAKAKFLATKVNVINVLKFEDISSMDKQ